MFKNQGILKNLAGIKNLFMDIRQESLHHQVIIWESQYNIWKS